MDLIYPYLAYYANYISVKFLVQYQYFLLDLTTHTLTCVQLICNHPFQFLGEDSNNMIYKSLQCTIFITLFKLVLLT